MIFTATAWVQIQKDLIAMSTIVAKGGRLNVLANYIYPQRKKRQFNAETMLLSELRLSLDALNAWITTTLIDYDTIAVLGI